MDGAPANAAPPPLSDASSDSKAPGAAGERPSRWRFRIGSRAAAIRLAVLFVLLTISGFIGHACMISMPGRSYSGPLPPATDREMLVAAQIKSDVERLAGEIGARNRSRGRAYAAAADHIESRLRSMGYAVTRQPSPANDPDETPGNIIAEIRGAPAADGAAPEVIIVGAHYDSYEDSPGADDNASGVAVVLALAESFMQRSTPAPRTLRFVLFADEEPPFFQTEEMGSITYARACRAAGDRIVGMISVETVGWYSDAAGSQKYPPPLGALYPDTGNFIGFVSNPASRHFLREVIGTFRETTQFPSEGGALPGVLPGISWSDHWAFWQSGFPALMVTDSAPYRYPHYHTREDTPDKVDAGRTARVAVGLERVVAQLVEARTVPGADAKSPARR